MGKNGCTGNLKIRHLMNVTSPLTDKQNNNGTLLMEALKKTGYTNGPTLFREDLTPKLHQILVSSLKDEDLQENNEDWYIQEETISGELETLEYLIEKNYKNVKWHKLGSAVLLDILFILLTLVYGYFAEIVNNDQTNSIVQGSKEMKEAVMSKIMALYKTNMESIFTMLYDEEFEAQKNDRYSSLVQTKRLSASLNNFEQNDGNYDVRDVKDQRENVELWMDEEETKTLVEVRQKLEIEDYIEE